MLILLQFSMAIKNNCMDFWEKIRSDKIVEHCDCVDETSFVPRINKQINTAKTKQKRIK